MSETVAHILTQIDALSQRERAELAHAVLRSLEPEDPGTEEAWEKELALRLERLQSGRSVEIPAEQVFANWRSRKIGE